MGHRGWCDNETCPCQQPGKPCGRPEADFPYKHCVCCGWEADDHIQTENPASSN